MADAHFDLNDKARLTASAEMYNELDPSAANWLIARVNFVSASM